MPREAFDQMREQIKADMEKSDKRIRDVENSLSNMQGRATVIGAIITIGLILMQFFLKK